MANNDLRDLEGLEDLEEEEENEAEQDEEEVEIGYDTESGDIITQDRKTWFRYGALYFKGNEWELREKIEGSKFFPDIWTMSDHGNQSILAGFYDETNNYKEYREMIDKLKQLKNELGNFEIEESDYINQYEESINDETVEILGVPLDKSHIIKQIDPISYELGLTNFCDDIDKEEDPKFQALDEEIGDLEQEIYDKFNVEV